MVCVVSKKKFLISAHYQAQENWFRADERELAGKRSRGLIGPTRPGWVERTQKKVLLLHSGRHSSYGKIQYALRSFYNVLNSTGRK